MTRVRNKRHHQFRRRRSTVSYSIDFQQSLINWYNSALDARVI